MAKKWYRLDTAALIFPVVARHNWSNVFRVSAVLTEEIDRAVLQQAVNDLQARFPALYVRLCPGFFWFYLEELDTPPMVREDYAYPVTFMSRKERSTCCLRVLVYRNRVAVEFFHSLTDGSGGSIYLQTLLSRYLTLKHGLSVTPGHGVLDPLACPDAEELEDSFYKYAAPTSAGRSETTAYRLHGTPEEDGFRHLLTGIADTDKLLEVAHTYHATVTAFLAGVMAECIIALQDEDKPLQRQRPVKIILPVNLRRLYGSRTMRNFVLTVNIGVDPKRGSYTLAQLCDSIGHQLAAEATPQNMAARIAANVMPQKNPVLRACPMFLKAVVMELVYADSGERKGCINISNLGAIHLPEQMVPYIERMDFIVGVQRSYPNNCSVVSLGNKTCINMIRSIREPELERRFFSRLVELGIPVSLESNRRN